MRRIGFVLVLMALSTVSFAGDRHGILEVTSFLYGDNTEFLANPYRDGETLFGGQVSIRAGVPIGSSSRLWLGVVTDSRWGSDRAFETKRPVISLEVGGPRDTFILGTLRSGQLGRKPWVGLWPDESGPHGLVPALQVDTLTMTRPYEAGLQWVRSHESWRHDVWISWQRLNTPEHRERFDTGANARIDLIQAGSLGELALLGQAHIVHEGGQLYHEGVVGDSIAGGPGIQLRSTLMDGSMRTEFLYLFSKHNPDRSDQSLPDRLNGHGAFLRISYERNGWRLAYIRWIARTFAKWEGDPNYGSIGDIDGVEYVERERDYDELSLSRRFTLDENAYVLANARLHWVDGSFDYSYRVAATINLRHVLRRDR